MDTSKKASAPKGPALVKPEDMTHLLTRTIAGKRIPTGEAHTVRSSFRLSVQ